MSKLSRRKLITTGLAATAGVTGLAGAAAVARRYGLVPPDGGGLFGPGETLTYAAQRILTRHSLAREFAPGQISTKPFANEVDPNELKLVRQAGVSEWRLSVDGAVGHPTSFSLAELKSLPRSSHITHLACEEGWSYIAEWTGVPLKAVLDSAGIEPSAREVLFRGADRGMVEGRNHDGSGAALRS